MLKKLQKKFILINMSLVGTVLLLVFASLLVSNYQQNVEAVENAMSRALQMKDKDGDNPLPEIGRQPNLNTKDPGDGNSQSSYIPTVSVVVDADNNIRIDGAQMATIDDEVLIQAVALVMASEEDTGLLSDYDLRYMRNTIPDEIFEGDSGKNPKPSEDPSLSSGDTRIVFADRSYELANMEQLVISSLLIGGLSLIALFFISYGLSKLAIRPVQRAWEQQRQFVADASHELKTPLTVILANTGILQSHPSDTIAAQKQWIDSTQDEGERMKRLIDDMLFLAKSDADRVPAILSRIDLSDTMWSCLLPFEALAYERGLTLDTQIEPDLFVTGDGGQLKQLILILLDNASKYSAPRGTITAKLSKSASGNAAVISIHNTGDPIPPEALPHIFERFYRAEQSRARSVSHSADTPGGRSVPSGYGLGLSIAKTIADVHQASLTCTSSGDEGTTFTFTIPLSRDDD